MSWSRVLRTACLVACLSFLVAGSACKQRGAVSAAQKTIPSGTKCALCGREVTSGGVIHRNPDGTTLYFCSTNCEQRYLMGAAGGAKGKAK